VRSGPIFSGSSRGQSALIVGKSRSIGPPNTPGCCSPLPGTRPPPGDSIGGAARGA
jgi:hypothetical protein